MWRVVIVHLVGFWQRLPDRWAYYMYLTGWKFMAWSLVACHDPSAVLKALRGKLSIDHSMKKSIYKNKRWGSTMAMYRSWFIVSIFPESSQKMGQGLTRCLDNRDGKGTTAMAMYMSWPILKTVCCTMIFIPCKDDLCLWLYVIMYIYICIYITWVIGVI